MSSSFSARLVDVVIGLLVAGLVSGLLVPAMGDAASGPLVLGVATFCVAGALLAGHVFRRRRDGD